LSSLEQAYSPEVFETLSREWQRQLSEHLRRVTSRTGPVLNWREPVGNLQQAEAWLAGPATPATDLRERFAGLLRTILASGQNLHHPRYIGHQVPASAPVAGLFDAISSITNQVMAIYEMGPWATAVEMAVLRALSRKVGWDPEACSGLLTHGGSLANLTALLTARNVRLPGSREHGIPAGATLVTHPDAHYCVTRSAGILGLGARHVVRVAIDERRHMDATDLDRVLTRLRNERRPIVAVSACACATPTGAFDPLMEIADVCRRHDVWLHVDAAHGGGLLMSRRHRHKLAGLNQADSLVWDAHKMLFVPALCAAVLYRDRAHRFETFQQDAPYLFDPSSPGMADIDSGLRTIECTKRATGFGLWGLWSLLGESVFEEFIDRTLQRAAEFFELLNDAEDFEPLHEPECNIVAFRYVPMSLREAPEELDRLQRELRTTLIRSGDYYIVQTTLDGRAALRVTVMNPLTTRDDLAGLLDAIRAAGRNRGA
jgi:L-2,4-diaminobutyrate decarboxylase